MIQPSCLPRFAAVSARFQLRSSFAHPPPLRNQFAPKLAKNGVFRTYHTPRRRCLPIESTRRPITTQHHPRLSHRLRSISTKPLPQQRGPVFRFFYRAFAYTGAFILVSGGIVLAFFIYDASTYREDLSYSDIPVSEKALNPRRGGRKNLPIAEVLVDDDDCPEMTRQRDKPKLVILGSGWGSVALLKTLVPGDYHVTVVSPCPYFLFTPMLPSATVGTLELRSLVEPIRRIVQRVSGHYLLAEAEEVEFSEKLVEVSQTDSNGVKRHFYLPYDKLVVGVGSTSNPHGVKGLENCNFLKSTDDARNIRRKILQNLEHACLPTTADEERRRLLSFVVCGGGPTGVEFAAELFDMLNEDLGRSFPKILRNEISVHLIQSRGHILNTYDEALSRFAEARFAHDQVEVLTNSRVKEVRPDKILFSQKDEHGETVTKELPMGFCLWSTGVSQSEFCQRISDKLEVQTNKHALETDSHLRLNGTPLGDVYAIGDCSTVQNNVADHLVHFLRNLAWEKGRDPENMHITFKEWQGVAQRVKRRFPQAGDHLRRLDKLFEQYDKNKSGTLDFGELHELLLQIDSKLTSLPATAQRADQQGKYLGRKFNKMALAAPGLRANEIDYGDLDEAIYKAFEYKHLGSLAYIGNAAVFDINGLSFSGGLLAVYLWRSVYFAESVSLRTRILLAMDWSKRALFGRVPLQQNLRYSYLYARNAEGLVSNGEFRGELNAMGKRPTGTRPSHQNEGAKRRDLGESTGPHREHPQVQSAQQLQQYLSFQQDSGLQSKQGIQIFKAFLDSIAYSEVSQERSRSLTILKDFLEAQTPRDHAGDYQVYLPDLFQTWSYAAQSNNESLLSAVPAVLALLLKTISSRIEFREHGTRLCRTILQLEQLKLVAGGLTANKVKEHIISPCVRLLTEIVSYDGGVLARKLYAQRDFTFKRLDILLGFRRVSSDGPVQDRHKPSIRYNAVRYLLANLKFQDQVAKSDILSQGRIIRALFKDLKEDSSEVITDILDGITRYVVHDESVPNNVKSRFLTGAILGRIATLYNYEADPEELPDNRKAVDKATHEFLLLVCTTKNSGVLVTQSGWYPPNADTDNIEAADAERSDYVDLGLESFGSSEKYQERVPVRNSTLSSFLQDLRPYANIMQSELALAIFKAAPELVADYFFKKRSFTLDPKLTPTWLGYSAFVFSTVQLPVPEFYGRHDGYSARPPPTTIVIENILPQPLTQKVLKRCLNQNEKLITFFAVRLLGVALEKLEHVLRMFRSSGWHANIREEASTRLVAEFCRRSPGMKEVIAVFRDTTDNDAQQREAVAKLMVLYYRIVPQIALEEKFDISLALLNLLTRTDEPTEWAEESDFRFRELGHLLQIAYQSPDMRWWHKPESLSLSPFTTVLKLVVDRPSGTPLKQIKALLRSILQRSGAIPIQDNSSLLEVIIASLQNSGNQSSSARVFEFLDKCLIRFVQKSVKYYEDSNLLSKVYTDADTPPWTGRISPLFATLVEQWPYVVKSGEESEKLEIAQWLARYIGYSKQLVEDDTLLAAVRDKLVSHARDRKCRAVLEKAFQEQRKDGFSEDQHISIQQLPPESVKQDPQPTAFSADIEEMLQGPQAEDEDHPGLRRWMRKDVQEAIDDGDVGELVICVCSEHEDIRKQALRNIERFMAKLEASSYVEWEQVYVLLGELVESIKETLAENAVPSYVGAFTSRALLVLADPLHFLYGKINRYLNKGPAWSISKLPSYWIDEILLNPPENDTAHGEELEWLLDTMIGGLRTKEDMELYRRCGAFEHFLSLYSSPHLPPALRKRIIRFIYRATYVDGSTTLLTRASILSWTHVQIAVKDSNTVMFKLLLERLFETCDHRRISDWSGGTVSDAAKSITTLI